MRSIEEIRAIAQEEKRQYIIDKVAFYSNPIHWSNNKRRRAGLPVLRGSVNKNRQTKFRSYRPTYLFCIIEDVIEDTIGDMFNKEFFNKLVEVKNFDG